MQVPAAPIRTQGVAPQPLALLAATAVFLTLIPVHSHGQDVTFSIGAGGGDEDSQERLERAIEAASLTASLDEGPEEEDAGPNVQDYVAAARADYRRLLTALYADGFYSGAISILIDGREAADLSPLAAPAGISRIDIMVQPGPRFTFGRADIAPLPPGTLLPDSFATGMPARSDEIRDAVRVGVDGWRSEGHAKAAAGEQQIIANHGAAQLDVAVALVPGPQLRFGELAVSGNERTRSARIVEIAGLPTGDVFDPEAVDRATARLRRTGTFSSVALVEADVPLADASLPFEAQVVEQPLRRIGFGAEISSLDGLALSSFWLHRNLFGGAERLRVDGRISNIGADSGGENYSLELTYGRPATFSPDNDLFITAGVSRLDQEDFLLTQGFATVGIDRRVTDDLTATVGVGLLTAQEENALGTRDYTLLTLPLGATLDRRDDMFDAKSGFYIDLDITPFVSLVGDANGARVYGDARAYYSFGAEDRVTLAARGQVGSVIGAELLDAPADYLFYSGGGGTVRGQSFQSLGVQAAPELRTGGRSFAGVQLEARVGVTERIGLVGFYDAGFVGPDSVPLQDYEYQAGAGIGLRYDTGIGPIRFDVATPVTGDDAGENIEVYIGIGQSF